MTEAQTENHVTMTEAQRQNCLSLNQETTNQYHPLQLIQASSISAACNILYPPSPPTPSRIRKGAHC